MIHSVNTPSLFASANTINMGLLSAGRPLTWAETKENAELVRQLGIDQFIRIYHDIKDRKNDCLKWGDEVS